MKNKSQKIIPNLWFDYQAEEAVQFYTSVFKEAKVKDISRYPEAGKEIHQQNAGSIMTIDFELAGLKFVALNGGPHFKFNQSISLFVLCDSEEEIEEIWTALLAGGSVLMPLESYEWSPKYGWLQDQFGLNWQLMLEPENPIRQKIVPLLFFTGSRHGKAGEAIEFYTSVFNDSEIEGILKYEEEDNNPYALGAVKHAQFQLEGQLFMAMDSGMENDFPFNEAISFIVMCEDQAEIDEYWSKLTPGGDEHAQQCGWLKDKFGVSWQVVPRGMSEIFNDPDKSKANAAMEAMLKMKKIDIEALRQPSADKNY